jgi:hypothetical protein
MMLMMERILSRDVGSSGNGRDRSRPQTPHGGDRSPRSVSPVSGRFIGSVWRDRWGLSDEIIQQRFDSRVCMRCGEADHRARDCVNEVKRLLWLIQLSATQRTELIFFKEGEDVTVGLYIDARRCMHVNISNQAAVHIACHSFMQWFHSISIDVHVFHCIVESITGKKSIRRKSKLWILHLERLRLETILYRWWWYEWCWLFVLIASGCEVTSINKNSLMLHNFWTLL